MRIAVLGPITTSSIQTFVEEIPDGFPSGGDGAPVVATLIGGLLSRGHEVCAITCGGYDAVPGAYPVSTRGVNFTFYCCPMRRRAFRISHGRVGRMVDLFRVERQFMLRVLAEYKPDLIHAHWCYEYGWAALDSGYPCVVSAHDDPIIVLKLFKDLYRAGRLLMALKVLRRAAVLTAVSEPLRAELKRLCSVEIDVIPNPLPQWLLNIGQEISSRWDRREYRIMSINNGWNELKNIARGIAAFSEVHRRHPEVSYHLFGVDYHPGGPAQRWAESRGLAAGVCFHGPVEQSRLVEFSRSAWLLLHPSRWEACPMSVAESMALGLPVVGGRESGGVPWMVGEGGLLVDVTDPTEIREAIELLHSDPKLYWACAQTARERVQSFTPEAVARNYEAVYYRALRLIGG